MAKKIASKKAVSTKTKSLPKKSGSKSIVSQNAKTSASKGKKPLPKGKVALAKKTPSAKAISKSSKKAVKPVKKAIAKVAQKKTSVVSKAKPSSSKKPVKKVTAKKTALKSVPAKKTVTKPIVAKKKSDSNSKNALSKEMKRRAEVNAKAAPKKSEPKKNDKGDSKSKSSNLKSAKKVEQPKVVTKLSDAKEKSAKKTSEKSAKKESSLTKEKELVFEISKKDTEQKFEPVDLLPTTSGKRIRPSNNIYFSLDDLNAYFERREVSQSQIQPEKKEKSKVSVSQLAPKRPVITPVPRQPLAVATISDILGINPVVATSREKLEEQDVPRKWKKYYKLLVDLRKHHSSGVETRAEEVMKRSAKDDAGDLSSYGQHLADAGSESFERDMAYNIISNQKEILSEIDEAIKRIKNGTYGICEVTGLPIPESRLTSIPYTRCTKEGQEIKEMELKRQKASRRTSLYDMSDGSQGASPSDEDSAS